jgi:hypothetical protein
MMQQHPGPYLPYGYQPPMGYYPGIPHGVHQQQAQPFVQVLTLTQCTAMNLLSMLQ